ncbi:MAG: MerR family transcriptional regulator [Acidimicrobiales bacterium]
MSTASTFQLPYLKAGEAAALLHVSPKTISRWAKEGRIPHVVTLGGHRRFSRDQIEELAGNLTGQVR